MVDDLGGLLAVDVARGRAEEDEAERIGARFDRHQSVFKARYSADFDFDQLFFATETRRHRGKP